VAQAAARQSEQIEGGRLCGLAEQIKGGPLRFHIRASRRFALPEKVSARFVVRHHSSFPGNGVLLGHREKRMEDE
jgi:hypothetical protein